MVGLRLDRGEAKLERVEIKPANSPGHLIWKLASFAERHHHVKLLFFVSSIRIHRRHQCSNCRNDGSKNDGPSELESDNIKPLNVVLCAQISVPDTS